MPRIPRRIAQINVLQHGLAPDGEPIEEVPVVVEKKSLFKKSKKNKEFVKEDQVTL